MSTEQSEAIESDIHEAIAAGKTREALGALVRRHGTAVGRLCFSMLGSKSEADDAVQETYLEAYTALSSFRGEGSAKAFLFAIARRRCARRLSRRGAVSLAPPLGSNGAGPEELTELAREGARIRQLLSQIRPSESEALLLRYLGELSFREVAEILGVDEAAARKRVSRALHHLRELLRK
jgi:RNA polymerase sigma-70 factor (ECF subfamily)